MISLRNLLTLCTSLSAALLLASASLGQNVTFVGSTGVAEISPSRTPPEYGNRAVIVPAKVSNGVSTLRYNIQPTTDLTKLNNTALVVNYADGGVNTSVNVTLYETDLFTNQVVERMHFYSDNYSNPPNWQTRTAVSSFDFNFTTKAYYLEVDLWKTNSDPIVFLAGLQLYRY
jgi:hypothetical protein